MGHKAILTFYRYRSSQTLFNCPKKTAAMPHRQVETESFPQEFRHERARPLFARQTRCGRPPLPHRGLGGFCLLSGQGPAPPFFFPPLKRGEVFFFKKKTQKKKL